MRTPAIRRSLQFCVRPSTFSETSMRPAPAATVAVLARLALLGLLLAGPAAAQSEMEVAEIKYRQALMDATGENMAAISTILKNRLPLPGHVESHATQIGESAKLVAAAFKNPISKGETDAKPEIWKDWAEFEARITELDKAANDLAAAAAGSDRNAVGPAVKALGKACGDCHKSFRKPKEESYKNQ